MNNVDYINRVLFLIHKDQKKNLEELPYRYDSQKHLFEIHLRVFTYKTNIKSTFNVSPHMVLIGYIQGKELATVMFKKVSHLFKTVSADTTASLLADMVTPNLRPDIWIKTEDLELEGYLITYVYLTLADMQKLVYFDTMMSEAIPENFCQRVTQCPSIFDFIPHLDTRRLDPEKVYVTTSIKYCKPKKEPAAAQEEEEEDIQFEIR